MVNTPKRTRILLVLGLAVGVGSILYFYPSSGNELQFLPSLDIPVGFRQTILLTHKDGSTSEHNGSELYKEHYLGAWRDCANAFIADRQWGSVKAWQYSSTASDLEAPWIIDAPDEINEVRRNGWIDCQTQIETLLESHSAEQTRVAVEMAVRQ